MDDMKTILFPWIEKLDKVDWTDLSLSLSLSTFDLLGYDLFDTIDIRKKFKNDL